MVTDRPQTVGDIQKLYASTAKACATFEYCSKRCWSDHTYGQLRFGFGDPRGGGSAHLAERILRVDWVGVGLGLVRARTTDRCVWCWGGNSKGPLGMADIR